MGYEKDFVTQRSVWKVKNSAGLTIFLFLPGRFIVWMSEWFLKGILITLLNAKVYWFSRSQESQLEKSHSNKHTVISHTKTKKKLFRLSFQRFTVDIIKITKSKNVQTKSWQHLKYWIKKTRTSNRFQN